MKTIAFFAFCLVACAHAQQVITPPAKQLMSGIRGKECKQPPKVYEGIAKRFDSGCLFVEDGPGACPFVGRVDFGRSWVCYIGMRQDSCDGEWKPNEMLCGLWEDKFQALTPHFWDEASEENKTDSLEHVIP